MARDVDSLLIRKWAATSSLVQTPEAAGLTRSVGLPASYGTTDFLPLEVFNQLWREITGAAVEAGEHGILPWNTGQSYPHDPISLVIGSDGELYKSVQASGGSLTSQDPTTDTSDTYWEAFAISVPNSSTTARGIIRTATTAEAVTGTATSPAVTPAGLRAAIDAVTPPSGAGEHLVTAAGTTTFAMPWNTDTVRVVAQGGGGGGLGRSSVGGDGEDTTVGGITAAGGNGGRVGDELVNHVAQGNGGDGVLSNVADGEPGSQGVVTYGTLTGLTANQQIAISVGVGGVAGVSSAPVITQAQAGTPGFALIVPVY